jgi:hypothetical protein
MSASCERDPATLDELFDPFEPAKSRLPGGDPFTGRRVEVEWALIWGMRKLPRRAANTFPLARSE